MHNSVSIRSPDGQTQATFHPDSGAIVSSLIMPRQGQPVEWLFRRDTFWTRIQDPGGSPFLFPVCGRHRHSEKSGAYRWNGKEYVMPLHGFSMYRPWKIESVESGGATLSLAANDETRSVYPFAFSMTLRYSVTDGEFACHHRVTNHGNDPMPYFSGFHPYFSMTESELETCAVHGAFRAIGTYNTGYTDITRWDAVGDTVRAAAMAKNDNVLELASDSPIYLTIKGETVAVLKITGQQGDVPFKYIQFYRSGTDPFVCVEPWMGLPNGLNRPNGAVRLNPGETHTATFSIASVQDDA